MSSRLLINPAKSIARSQQLRGVFISTTIPRLRIKESSDQNYEVHKQDSIAKAKQGKGHWKHELASDSEAAIKADRHGRAEDVKTMQERTKATAEDAAKSGTSMKDGL